MLLDDFNNSIKEIKSVEREIKLNKAYKKNNQIVKFLELNIFMNLCFLGGFIFLGVIGSLILNSQGIDQFNSVIVNGTTYNNTFFIPIYNITFNDFFILLSSIDGFEKIEFFFKLLCFGYFFSNIISYFKSFLFFRLKDNFYKEETGLYLIVMSFFILISLINIHFIYNIFPSFCLTSLLALSFYKLIGNFSYFNEGFFLLYKISFLGKEKMVEKEAQLKSIYKKKSFIAKELINDWESREEIANSLYKDSLGEEKINDLLRDDYYRIFQEFKDSPLVHENKNLKMINF